MQLKPSCRRMVVRLPDKTRQTLRVYPEKLSIDVKFFVFIGPGTRARTANIYKHFYSVPTDSAAAE